MPPDIGEPPAVDIDDDQEEEENEEENEDAEVVNDDDDTTTGGGGNGVLNQISNAAGGGNGGNGNGDGDGSGDVPRLPGFSERQTLVTIGLAVGGCVAFCGCVGAVVIVVLRNRRRRRRRKRRPSNAGTGECRLAFVHLHL